jgi:hypothetical protein
MTGRVVFVTYKDMVIADASLRSPFYPNYGFDPIRFAQISRPSRLRVNPTVPGVQDTGWGRKLFQTKTEVTGKQNIPNLSCSELAGMHFPSQFLERNLGYIARVSNAWLHA